MTTNLADLIRKARLAGQTSKAYNLASESNALESSDGRLLLECAEAAAGVSDLTGKIQYLTAALPLISGKPRRTALLKLLEAQRVTGNSGAAYQHAIRAERLYPDYVPVLREVAKAYGASKHYLKSVKAWEAVVLHLGSSTHEKDFAQLAQAYDDACLIKETIRVLRHGLLFHSSSSLLKMRLGEAQAKSKVKMEILAEGKNYNITSYQQKNGPSKVLFITFGSISSGLKSVPFGFKFLIDAGFDLVYVAQEKHTLYQELSIDAFFQAVQPLIEQRQIFTYGSSLGGYAALYFGGCIDAKTLVAGPVNYVDPAIRVPRWSRVAMQHIPPAQAMKSKYSPVIFYDPLDDTRDEIYLKERILPSYPDALVFPLPGAGHQCFRALLEHGILKHTVQSFVQGNIPNPTLQAFVRDRNKQSDALGSNAISWIQIFSKCFNYLFIGRKRV
ncbi:hypothetical protein E4L95_02825 [Paracoccus liaowanqingii]|uniref:Alpha/beta hydrolase n=1 Tax=Paracoccus liaowanqingii TaxID=2560053 RepID=A0A4Z1CRR5_9RHOB|nr:hypothetical protein [Paracoccus liaowanqingii]TGN68004.1 hypothetical protein E4L95_02825 [Paracoccus liaowanqingii]